MSEYINRDSIYNKLESLFNYWLDNTVSSNISVNVVKQKVLPMIMEEIPTDFDQELNCAQRDIQNYLIKDLREIIPEALWDKTAEKLSADQCYSCWQYCLECLREMKDAWEAENGENLVWVPGHYEEVKDENH